MREIMVSLSITTRITSISLFPKGSKKSKKTSLIFGITQKKGRTPFQNFPKTSDKSVWEEILTKPSHRTPTFTVIPDPILVRKVFIHKGFQRYQLKTECIACFPNLFPRVSDPHYNSLYRFRFGSSTRINDDLSQSRNLDIDSKASCRSPQLPKSAFSLKRFWRSWSKGTG